MYTPANYGSYLTQPAYTGNDATLLSGLATMPDKSMGAQWSSALGTFGPIMGIMGALGGAAGTFLQSKSLASQLRFQADMAKINQRMAENVAQSVMEAGASKKTQVGLMAGKVKGAQRADQAARGVVVGQGSGAESLATTDLMKEIDLMTIDTNTLSQAWAARTQGVNAGNQALISEATASGINPAAAAGTSLLGSATQVASNWYGWYNKRKTHHEVM